MCAFCANGFYTQLGECVRCPENSESGYTIIVLICLATLLFSIAYASVATSQVVLEGISRTLRKEFLKWLAKDFVIWTILLLQLLPLTISVGGETSPAFATLFSWLMM